MSYFAKPNFIIYDEWFDDDLENFKFDVRNTKIKPISYIHDFFYEQSNYQFGGSENNFEFNIKVNEEKLLKNFYYRNTSEKLNSVSIDMIKNAVENIPNALPAIKTNVGEFVEVTFNLPFKFNYE